MLHDGRFELLELFKFKRLSRSQFFHELSLKELQIALEEFLDELRPLVNFFMIFTHPKPPPSLFGVNVFQRLFHFGVVTGSIKRLKKY